MNRLQSLSSCGIGCIRLNNDNNCINIFIIRKVFVIKVYPRRIIAHRFDKRPVFHAILVWRVCYIVKNSWDGKELTNNQNLGYVAVL